MAKRNKNKASLHKQAPMTPAPAAQDHDAGWAPPISLYPNMNFSAFMPGVAMSDLTAMQSATVYGCVLTLSDDVAKLPFGVVPINKSVPRASQKPHPLNRLLRNPNGWQTPFEFVSYIVASQQLRGNAYVAVLRDKTNGNPIQLVPIHPDNVSWKLNPTSGSLSYWATHPRFGSRVRRFNAEDFIHIRGLCMDGGFEGRSPISMAPEVVGLALAQQTHRTQMFRQGTMLSGVITHPGKLKPDGMNNLANSWKSNYQGNANAHKVAILEEGAKFLPISMTAADAQLLEGSKASDLDICRLFRMPPHMQGIMEHTSYTNIENQNQSYIDGPLASICTRIQQAFARDLLFDDEQDDFEFKFNFDVMLRGDFKTRMEGYSIAMNAKLATRNELRAREGWAPTEGGDVFEVPILSGEQTEPPEDNTEKED